MSFPGMTGESLYGKWIVGSSPTMTKKTKPDNDKKTKLGNVKKNKARQ